MGNATAVSDLERAEHLNYGDGKGVKRVSAYNDGVQVNVATEETLQTISEGLVSASNSTTTPLGTNGVFTGSWEDTLGYSEVAVSVYTDKSSATNGLDIQWSMDGVNVHAHDNFTISATSGKQFTFPCNPRYVRVVYTNDGVAQTQFVLQTVLKRYASKGSSHRLKDALVQEDDAIATKSLIAGFTTSGGGGIVDVKVSPSGAMQVGGTVGVTNVAGTSINPATEEKQIPVTIIATKSTDTNIIYIGKAPPGSSGSSAVWQISKIDDTQTQIKTYADNGNFSQVWTNRESLSYS